MGDSGEGLIDAAGKIQERMEEQERERELATRPAIENPEQLKKIESLKLARTEMVRQLNTATHDARKTQINDALAEIDRRIAKLATG